MGETMLVAFVTDVEGNYAYWRQCIELSSVVDLDDRTGDLHFSRAKADDMFVFGGDVFDKGPGDIRIASALVRFKTKHPDRVFLLAGNRDLVRNPRQKTPDGPGRSEGHSQSRVR